MDINLTEAFLISLATGAATAIATVAAIRTDIGWLKHATSRAHKRIDEVEKRVANIENRCSSCRTIRKSPMVEVD